MDNEQQTTTLTAEEAEAERLFSEFSAARAEGKDVSEVIGSPAPAEETTPAAESQPAIEAEPQKEQPVQQPTEPKAPAPAAIDWSVLPPAAKAAYDKAESERRAAIGRAAAEQRRVAQLQQQLKAQQSAPAPAAADEAPSPLKNQFPELDEAVDKKMQAREAQLAALLRHEFEQSTTKIKADALEAVFPGWHKTMQSDDFQYWLTLQGEDAQQKWNGNSVGDYAALLRDYKGMNQPAAPSTTAADILAERQARLRSATSVEGRNVPANRSGEPDPNADGEAYFNYLARKGERERAALNRR